MQLDLFTQRLPATIHAFPLARRHSLINSTAKALTIKSYSQGKAHWTRLVNKLWKEMTVSGLSTQMIDAEISALADAVSKEMNIRKNYRRSSERGT